MYCQYLLILCNIFFINEFSHLLCFHYVLFNTLFTFCYPHHIIRFLMIEYKINFLGYFFLSSYFFFQIFIVPSPLNNCDTS
ncbi:hypothetical protein GLOIN_2v1548251 [Rhizophagus irregularis DAOM 181602=DAOM 197198]|uniref:Uncharacterized protein n=1 Tax=Rhizophagus irregularis (strain DAOM 181602 / DAOM 197198 / MUCL 43194) TaxID=747089 RepID=A0A2P4QI83_RHIID|nr:hypothetical protein GLOIN_2v1548251 [Rhizophagus irregularis DAOM 181602=DAOM 197198]POG77357.1 hypothetical protein GLOIN_2v1548251 [Rhizophagus irregularis DAOM 181602=DAOM 197198]GET50285.1 hypothetical protein GLOIN_2v1548251 [Rhizophagus irregularis DAOM 181602=DAOM 197198]|eukprot:XP_025184223.1 hypothetical protein GLOIN_2v1548251 [Rhizophagus irregularis DAOM 181602=DAOM 197198]